jgi:hypothetical protein
MDEFLTETNDNVPNESLLIDGDIFKTLNYFMTAQQDLIRQDFGKVLMEIFRQPIEDIEVVFPTLLGAIEIVAELGEVNVRSGLIKHVPIIFQLFDELPHGRELSDKLYERFLDIVLTGLRDVGPHVRKSANTALCLIIEKYPLEQKTLIQKICTSIQELSKMVISDQQFIDCYTIAIGLMAKSAPFIGPAMTEEFFLPRFIELCDYDQYLVRRTCATYFPVFCKVMGTDVT